MRVIIVKSREASLADLIISLLSFESWEPLEITIKSPYQVFTIFIVSLLNTKMAGSGNWLHAWNKKSTVQKRFTMYSVYTGSYCLLVKIYCIIWWMNRKTLFDLWFEKVDLRHSKTSKHTSVRKLENSKRVPPLS